MHKKKSPFRAHFASLPTLRKNGSVLTTAAVGGGWWVNWLTSDSAKTFRRILNEYQRRILASVMWLFAKFRGLEAIVGVLNTTCGRDFLGRHLASFLTMPRDI